MLYPKQPIKKLYKETLKRHYRYSKIKLQRILNEDRKNRQVKSSKNRKNCKFKL